MADDASFLSTMAAGCLCSTLVFSVSKHRMFEKSFFYLSWKSCRRLRLRERCNRVSVSQTTENVLHSDESVARPVTEVSVSSKECQQSSVTNIAVKNDKPKLEVTAENQFQKLAEAVTPLWEMPYSRQLTVKYEKNKAILRNVGVRMKETNCAIRLKNNGLPCRLHPVQPSPIQEHYRNKDEFCVNVGVDGYPKTVGFYVGRPKHGGFVCIRGDHLVITKESHKVVAKLFEEYIKTSPLDACLRFDQGGFWRHIQVRSNSVGDLMAAVIVHPQQMDKDAILEEQGRLKDYFVHGAGRQCGLKSLFFQSCRHTKCTNEESPYILLHGDSHLYDSVCGLRIRISPDSFFQVNTAAAEVLYKTIREACYIDETTTLLDICCGTGIIGLMMSRQCEKVIGIELVKHAVDDAKSNAELNGIRNAEYHVGKVENIIEDFSKVMAKKDCVAVANPSRSGLHINAINALRKSKKIHQLIYVSCQPDGIAMKDFVRLCSPKSTLPGQPFVLRDAVPVDLFPHTHHCELILTFDHNWKY